MGFWELTILVMLPVMIFAGMAQSRIKSTYKKYSRVGTRANITGAELAQRLISENGINEVTIKQVSGNLTDHYDPRNKKLGLSRDVYSSTSIAALGVAAHEIGHAVQHARGNFLLRFRNVFAPVAQFGSSLAFPLILIGLLFQWGGLAELGVLFFFAVVVFHLVTVPVEIDASRKALHMLKAGDYMQSAELADARKVLNAAALTYIASLMVAIANLLRMLVLVRR